MSERVRRRRQGNMRKPLRVLIAEDSADDAELILREGRALRAALIREEIIGIQHFVANELVGRAME